MMKRFRNKSFSLSVSRVGEERRTIGRRAITVMRTWGDSGDQDSV